MKQTLLRLHRQEDGQVMLLALITSVFLVLVMAFPLNVGWTISKRLKLQNAADASAFSAAVVQADGLSAIAWLNNAMSWCYQRQYGLELKFSTYGVYALLERWGDEKGTNKPKSDDYDLDGVAWYQDFKNRVKGKTPLEAFSAFMGNEARLISRQRNAYAVNDRTLEMWTRTLRIVAEEIATQLPHMMRYEAMRIAYVNTYDGSVGANPANQVYMAFFPDVDSNDVQLNFKPQRSVGGYSGDVASDNSFLQYERWHDADGGGCRFVERAMQIAAEENEFFMEAATGWFGFGGGTVGSGKLHQPEIGDHHIIDDKGKLNMSSIDLKNLPWYNEYDGQPRRINGVYTAFAKTVICWHKKDKDGPGDHEKPDKTPCGHWHPRHTHVHYNCQHITIPQTPYTPEMHFHIPMPTTHEKGFEKNHWCLVENRDSKCSKWYSPPPGCGCLGVADIQGLITQGVDAAQKVVDQCTAVRNQAQEAVNQAEAAYNAVPSTANLQAWQNAKNQLIAAEAKLEEARAHVQQLLNTAALAATYLSMNPLAECRVNMSVVPSSDIHLPVVDSASPGKGSGEAAWWHHAVHYCDLCFTKDGAFNREFPKSAAAGSHGLAYYRSSVYVPDQSQRADEHFSVARVSDSVIEKVKGKKKSMVRAYIEDLLSYSESFSSNWPKFKREAAFHQIHKSNYSPELPEPAPGKIDAKLCPTIILKPVNNPADRRNFFNWGITVALWQKHHSIMFRKYTASEGSGGVFAEIEGMLAIASAKVGIRANSGLYASKSGAPKGAYSYFPERLICGIGERSRSGEPSRTYDAAYMRERFLINRDRKEPILNLFHTDWGARLIPIQKSVPAGEAARAAKYVLSRTNRMYYYRSKSQTPGVRFERIASGNRTGIDAQGWTDQQWEFLTRLLVH